MKKSNIALLLLIPIIVLIFNLAFVRNQRKFFFSFTDPTYAYLFNGMNIANGKLEVGHFDHPGTTVQTGAGICIRLIYTFSGKEKDLSTDLLSDPERYIHIVSFIFILVNCFVVFYSGFKIYKVGGNLLTALFFQSGVIVFLTTLSGIPDLRPESFLVWGVLLLVTFCYCFIQEKEISNKKMLGYAVKFGLIGAFLAVTKITSLPLLIIPVFLLRKWLSWFVYAASFIFFGIIFLIPALSKFYYFLQWVHSIIFHSGIYGTGEEKIIDATAFKQDLTYIFTYDIIFGIILAFIAITILKLIFTKQLKFSNWKTNPSLRLLVGVFITAIGCVIIVAKHFKFHYLIPGYGIMMLGAYLSFQFIFSPGGKFSEFVKRKNIQAILITVFILFYVYSDYSRYYWNSGLSNPKTKTAAFMQQYKDVPRLYVTYEFYAPEVSPALYFGNAYSGMMKETYIPILEKLYPLTNFYSFPENSFHNWRKQVDFKEFVLKNKKMLVSFYMNDPNYVNGSMKILNDINEFGRVIEMHKIFENPETGETIFEMNRVGNPEHAIDSLRVIKCDAENSSSGTLVSTDSSYIFQGIECKTDKEHHSGKYSLELNSTNQYGFGFHMILKTERHYEISAWIKSPSGKGVLMAQGKTEGVGGSFYTSSSTVVETGENGWNKISLKFQVPQNLDGKSITLAAWNESGNQVTYFDDFTIVEY